MRANFLLVAALPLLALGAPTSSNVNAVERSSNDIVARDTHVELDARDQAKDGECIPSLPALPSMVDSPSSPSNTPAPSANPKSPPVRSLASTSVRLLVTLLASSVASVSPTTSSRRFSASLRVCFRYAAMVNHR